MTKIKNASQYPKRFYGLHFAEGCAEYKTAPDKSFMIFIGENAIKNMDATFEGKPVFVGHRDEVTPEMIPDGHVIKSFFNKADGKTWVEFIVTSDEGLEAISKGWELSNAYKIVRSGAGGRWHGIDYGQEVVEGEYEHLAIVPDPRYEESIVLSPEEFKTYNEQKEAELKKLQNSKKTGVVSMFKFFKKEKVENSADLETMSVILPKSKKEVDVARLINEADEAEMKNGEPVYAVEHALVKTNEGEMSVKELLNKYNELCLKKNEEEEKKKENEVHVDIDSHKDEKKENKDEDKEVIIKEKENEDEGLDNEEDEEEEEEEEEDEMKKNKVKKNSKENFEKLKNAHDVDDFESGIAIDLSMDQVARGKVRYGNGK